MNELVVDSSVVVKWFYSQNERHVSQARAILDEYNTGAFVLSGSLILQFELLNVAARTVHAPEAQLLLLATRFESLRIELVPVPLPSIVPWAARGLTAYDASYVALAEQLGTVVVTDDQRMLAVAPGIAVPLATFDIEAFLAS